MIKKACWLLLTTILFITFCVAPACASTIRVALQKSAASITLQAVSGDYSISGGLPSRDLADLPQGSTLQATYSAGTWTLQIDGDEIGSYAPPIAIAAQDSDCLMSYQNTRYRGGFGLMSSGLLNNVVDMEDYLRGVIGKEMGYDAPMAALEAQAVASRSYAYVNLDVGASYDVSATTASQVYGGYDAEVGTNGAKVVEAVENTADLVMYYENDNGAYELVEGVYHAHAGGYTENSENVWGGEGAPYLKAVASPYDTTGPAAHNQWQVTYTGEEITNLVNQYKNNRNISGDFGSFTSMEVSYDNRIGGGVTASGRATKVVVNGTKGQLTVYRDDIRSLLNLKSTLFTVNNQGATGAAQETIYIQNAVGNPVEKSWRNLFSWGKDGIATLLSNVSGVFVKGGNQTISLDGTSTVANTNIVIDGKGWGHGVGMSQWGARGMANDGYTYEEILQHYYGGNDAARLKITEVGNQ